MAITPVPLPGQLPSTSAGQPDLWSNASFYDVTLVNMACALIASGNYAPGPLISQLAVAGAAEAMYQTGRWARPPNSGVLDQTPEEAAALFRDMGRGK